MSILIKQPKWTDRQTDRDRCSRPLLPFGIKGIFLVKTNLNQIINAPETRCSTQSFVSSQTDGWLYFGRAVINQNENTYTSRNAV